MPDMEQIKRVYFIGIGGIGMSALARYFRFHGREVSGYDRTATPLTRQLESEGIPVHYEDRPSEVPPNADLVVYTPAIPADMKELVFCREQGYSLMKRSEVLGLITESSFTIAVAGTHGKTTITTMIAHLLRHSGYGCNAFLGGISVNYGTNYWSDARNCSVVEADEYDRSFLRLSPDIAVVTAMDADHLDIYGTAAAVEEAFISFTQRIKPGGMLVHQYGLHRAAELAGSRRLSYGFSEEADLRVTSLRIDKGAYRFNIEMADWKLTDCSLLMGGLHNVGNMLAAVTVAHELGIAEEKIRAAIASFRGVKRRFEFLQRSEQQVFIDDYAHHPEELKALLTGVRDLFPQQPCTLIFQPHLFSRTRDLAEGFAQSLDLADEVILLPVYPARELPIEGVSSEMIASRMKKARVRLIAREALLETLAQERAAGKHRLLLTAGAGDIDALLPAISRMLEQQTGKN